MIMVFNGHLNELTCTTSFAIFVESINKSLLALEQYCSVLFYKVVLSMFHHMSKSRCLK